MRSVNRGREGHIARRNLCSCENRSEPASGHRALVFDNLMENQFERIVSQHQPEARVVNIALPDVLKCKVNQFRSQENHANLLDEQSLRRMQ